MTEFKTKYLYNNPYYNDGKWIYKNSFKGFILHSVGCSQPSVDVFYNKWNNPNFYYAGINGFLNDKKIYITAPCFESINRVKRMPHGGKPYTNNYYIGFEMCEPDTIKYTGCGCSFEVLNRPAAQKFVMDTYKNAVDLFARLCIFHKKDPLKPGVIYSHNEAGKLGIATGHLDPEHLWHGVGLNLTMTQFRNDVAKRIDEEENDMTQDKFNEMFEVMRSEWRDNDSHNYSKDARKWAIDTGLLKGGNPFPDGTPNYMFEDLMTREQMVTMLYRFKEMMLESMSDLAKETMELDKNLIDVDPKQ